MAVAVRPTRSAAPDDAADLFERYSERIHAYCLHVLRDRTEAEDAVQTTFLNAHRALRRGVTPVHEYAWLHTIAKNACRMQQRTKSRRAPVADVDVDTIARSEDDGDAAELRAAVGDALSRLPERQRRAVLLREWYGLSPQEIAPRLGLSVPATYAVLTRARRSLASALTATVRGPLMILDLSGIADALRGLKAYFGGAAAKTAVAAAVVTASVSVGGGVVVDRALRGSADRAPSGAAESVLESTAGHAVPASRVAEARHRPTAASSARPRDWSSTGLTAPAATGPPPTSEPTGAVEQPSQSPSEPTGSGGPPSQPPPERGDGSPPAPGLPPPIEAPVLPVLPPLPELPGTDEPPVPVDASPLPSQPDPTLPPADPVPPLPQLPLP